MGADIAVGIGVGLITGLLSWWVTSRAITARIALSDKISKLPALDSEPGEWRYRFKMLNKRRLLLPKRAAVELDVSAVFVFKSFRADDSIDRVRIPVGAVARNDADLEVSYLEKNRALRLRTEEMRSSLLPLEIQQGLEDATVTLEGLFDAVDDGRLEVVVNASHGYTHARSTAFATYHRIDIECGEFVPEGIELKRDASKCSEG